MSKLTDEEFFTLRPVVAQVAIQLKRRYGMLDRADLEQEAWVWVLKRTKEVRELLTLDDEEESIRLLVYRMSLGVKAWAEVEKGAALGYDPDDVFFYTTRELGVLVGVMFDRDQWLKAPVTEADGPSNRQDPAVGGNWVATLTDVSRAYDRLPDEERQLLFWYYKVEFTQEEISEMLGVAQKTVSRRIERALGRLHEELGGEQPTTITEYTGSRRHMGNAQMNAITRSYE